MITLIVARLMENIFVVAETLDSKMYTICIIQSEMNKCVIFNFEQPEQNDSEFHKT